MAFPVPIKMPVHIDRGFTLTIPGGHFVYTTFYQKITRLSCDTLREVALMLLL